MVCVKNLVIQMVYIQGNAELVHSAHEVQRVLESFLVEERHVLRNFTRVELFPRRGNSISKGSEMDISANKGYL